MLERLAGRLTWEQSGNGILVEIPARHGWVTLFFCVWLAGWSIAGRQVFLQTFTEGTLNSYRTFNLLWMFGWAAGECFVGAAIIWAVLGRITVVIDPSVLEITHRIAGFPVRSRSFPTSEVRNLRYVPSSGGGRSRRESAICFESADKTIRFGSGLADAEALALIDKMLGVYSFPKERALEYLDLSR
jgi:hypothetical protein